MLCGYLDFYQRLSSENEKAGRLFVRANSRCPTIYVCSISLLRGFGSCRKAKRPFLHPRFGIFRIQPFEIQKTAWLRGFLPKYLLGFPMMAGAEGFEPSARGFGVDVEKASADI